MLTRVVKFSHTPQFVGPMFSVRRLTAQSLTLAAHRMLAAAVIIELFELFVVKA
jgi:hypothetical protein